MYYDMVEILGLMAGACTVTSFLPQVIKVWRTKSVKDISLGMYALLIIGISLWLIYGLVVGAMSIIITNFCTLTLISFIFALKLKYGKSK